MKVEDELIFVKITVSNDKEGYWYLEEYNDQQLGRYSIRDRCAVGIAETLCSSKRSPEFVFESKEPLTVYVEFV